MIRTLGTVFAGLLGLAFGSFLNVCVSRWPAGESVAHPRSHCRSCGRTLARWENIPLVSWIVLRGRCRSCKAGIRWRYPVVELAVGALWASVAWRLLPWLSDPQLPGISLLALVISSIGQLAFYWLLVGLAVLDAENLWLPDRLTGLGFIIGLALSLLNPAFGLEFDSITRLPLTYSSDHLRSGLWRTVLFQVLGVLIAAALILFIRWIYWLVRRREGIGLGDAKLMALLAAWLGLAGALVAFAVGVTLGAAVAIVVLAVPSSSARGEGWALTKLPFGTFLCAGGIISGLCGQQILAGYLRWAGF